MNGGAGEIIDLSAGWSFVRGGVGRRWLAGRGGPSGEAVDLPHCWNALDGFRDGVDYYRGPGAYRRRFALPARADRPGDRVWLLEADGFYGTGEVWVNGRRAASVDGHYLGFSIDVGHGLRWGSENQIGLRLTNRCASYVLPGIDMPDFLLHGGMTSGMTLRGRNAFHIEPSSLQIQCGRIEAPACEVTVSFSVANGSAARRSGRARWTIRCGGGRVVAEHEGGDVCVGSGGVSPVQHIKMTIPDRRLWSPDDPFLYRLEGVLREAEAPVDAVGARLGIREAVFRPHEGFFLNGRRMDLRGCNRHESMPGFGSALPQSLHREDAAAIKSLGLNFVRLSHYPQSPGFLDACDELGLLVYAEIATWKSVRGGRWLERACRQMEGLIRRDRNRPCVIVWGMGNESRSRGPYQRLAGLAREIDPTRPVTYAENHWRRAVKAGTTDLPDVWGCNYELEAVEKGTMASRLKTAILTECANYPYAVRGDLDAEARQVESVESALSRTQGCAAIAGYALWCFNDYATLRKRRYRRHSGVFDAWRVPKMAGALLRAMYQASPVVQIFADWGSGCGGAGSDPVLPRDDRRAVHVFTNCGEVVLSIDGREAFVLRGRRYAMCSIPFEQADLVAEGRKGDAVARWILPAHGAARALSIRPEADRCAAVAGRVVGFCVVVVDAAGRDVPCWRGEVKATVDAPGRLRSPYGDGVVPVAGGKGRAFVCATGQSGRARLRAETSGLEPGGAVIEFVEGDGGVTVGRST